MKHIIFKEEITKKEEPSKFQSGDVSKFRKV